MSRRVNLIPAAGAGARFAEAGYAIPKPLLPVDGEPMIVRAARALPEADLCIFCCRAEHLAQFPLEATLGAAFPHCRIVTVPALTAGQAATCLLAEPWLREDDELTIGPCDAAVTRTATEPLWTPPGIDALIWTFRGNPAVLQDPRMYGWVDVGTDGTVRRVSVKVPISETPLADHAVVGTFSFRRAGDFLRAAHRLVALDRRVRGEFYVDDVMNDAIALGTRTGVLEVGAYVGWGTPMDYERHLSGAE